MILINSAGKLITFPFLPSGLTTEQLIIFASAAVVLIVAVVLLVLRARRREVYNKTEPFIIPSADDDITLDLSGNSDVTVDLTVGSGFAVAEDITYVQTDERIT